MTVNAVHPNEAGGRELLLIRTFMDEVIYNSTGNQITLLKRARRPQEVPR